jgi:hypothetical protein
MERENYIPSHIHELKWLAQFYELHGHQDKSAEILLQLGNLSSPYVKDLDGTDHEKVA